MKTKRSLLRNYRKQADLTQEELGRKIGVSRQTINNWEAGLYSPTEDNIVEMAKIFNITPDKLFEEYQDENRSAQLDFRPSSTVRLYESAEKMVKKDPEGLVTVNYDDPLSLLCIRINDDTLTSFKLPKGTIAVIRTKGLVMSGIIGLISINHETPKIARITTDGDFLTLSYGSKKYPDEKYDLYRTSVEVIGRVIGYLGDI